MELCLSDCEEFLVICFQLKGYGQAGSLGITVQQHVAREHKVEQEILQEDYLAQEMQQIHRLVKVSC